MRKVTFDKGCMCHHAGLCDFCTEMAEEEREAFEKQGYFGLIPFIDRMCNADYAMVMEKAHGR